ncbi:hypothetical protein [Nesterenkonia rhizosphaerae]|uniref:Uncharacterized protein n=1 Tax=Nesterenkonia rhizosphaerae TaxID=1348272 RepID=A0ABP9G108_9MICC
MALTDEQIIASARERNPELAEASYVKDGTWFKPNHKPWPNQERAKDSEVRRRVDLMVFGRFAGDPVTPETKESWDTTTEITVRH